MKKSILLLSSSSVHGYGFLEYNDDAIRSFVEGVRTPLLFVPYAADENNWDAYTVKVRYFFESLSISVRGIHTLPNQTVLNDFEVIFIGGGNTFRLLHTMQELRLMDPIREAVLAGRMAYMGSSAGTNMACKTICTTNDMPIVFPKQGFDALNLLPLQINAHYLDPDPDSKHMGETRGMRIAEFHQVNNTPVIGLREGSYIHCGIDFPETGELTIGGAPGAKIFFKGRSHLEAPRNQQFVFREESLVG